jgi:rhomboid family GlyGly-CTERM serine protease
MTLTNWATFVPHWRQIPEFLIEIAMPFARWINTDGLSIYLLAAACLMLGPWSNYGMQFFSLDRAGLEQGEYWRLWSGPLVHASWTHLALNMAGLIILQQLFGEELKGRHWLTAFSVLSPVIGICWYASPAIPWLPANNYAYITGLSAVLHGLFVYAACSGLRRDRVLASIVLLAISTKVALEQIFGASASTAELIDLPVATDAHMYGFVGGVAFGLVARLIRDSNRPPC